MGGRAGRKGGAGNREEEEAMQGRGAEATGQGGWAENKLRSGGGVPQEDRQSSQLLSLSGTQFPMHWEDPERRG